MVVESYQNGDLPQRPDGVLGLYSLYLNAVGFAHVGLRPLYSGSHHRG